MSRMADTFGWPVDLLRRLAVTVAAVAGIVALGWVPAPGLYFRQGALYGISNTPVAVGQLGIVPFAVGFVLVEWVASVWPGTLGSRPFGADRPDVLGRIAVATGLALAVVQAATLTWYWLGFMPAQVGAAFAGPATGWMRSLTAGTTLVAGASLFALAAHWVRERGLGDGFAVVFGVAFLWNTVPAGEKFGDWLTGMNLHNLDVFGVLGNVLAVSAVILGTLWTVVRLEDWVAGEPMGSEEEPPVRSASTPFHAPAAGVVPFAAGSAVLWAFWTGRALSGQRVAAWFGEGFEAVSYGGSFNYFVQELVVVLGVGLIAGWIAARIDARYASRPDPEVASMRRRAQVASLGFLAGLVVLDVYGGPLLSAFGVANLVCVTAIGVDLAREVRFRAAFPETGRVASLHRTGMVGPVLERLAEEDVPALARGRCFRGMLRTFGAFSAVEVVVPESSRERAREALDEMSAET